MRQSGTVTRDMGCCWGSQSCHVIGQIMKCSSLIGQHIAQAGESRKRLLCTSQNKKHEHLIEILCNILYNELINKNKIALLFKVENTLYYLLDFDPVYNCGFPARVTVY